jgi:hypothetical protein
VTELKRPPLLSATTPFSVPDIAASNHRSGSGQSPRGPPAPIEREVKTRPYLGTLIAWKWILGS